LAANAFPNPFNSRFKAQFEADTNKEATIIVIDGLGKEVFKKKTEVNRGLNTFEIDLGNQPGGMYFLNIISNRSKQQIKLIKQ